MHNYEFKIFGAPHTFDLYNGNEAEISYFQNFDNGAKENVKLTIHRMMSGKVSYSYLRYNFISSIGRSNSFFGMSLLFDNAYCKDIAGLFNLFDTIYRDIILKNGILLSALNNNPTAQAKFVIQAFAEGVGEVKNIENNIINNLKSYFEEDILPLDSSFLESNTMVKLNNQIDNNEFIKALRKYSWVHISPEYYKNETPIPNHEFLGSLNAVIIETNKRIPEISIKVVEGQNIKQEAQSYLNEVDKSINKIFSWLDNNYKQQKKASKNQWQKLLELKELKELKDRYNNLSSIQQQLKQLIAAVKPKQSSGDSSGTDNVSSQEEDSKQKKLNLGIIAAIAIGLVILGVVFWTLLIPLIIPPLPVPDPDPSPFDTEDSRVDSLVALGDQALSKGDYNLAILKYLEADRNDLVLDAKLRAIQDFKKKAAGANTLQKAIDYLYTAS